VFILCGIKLLGDGYAIRIFDIFQDLAAQRPLADGLQSAFEVIKIVFAGKSRKLVLETLQVTEGIIINDAHKAIEFKKGVLKRCGRQQEFGTVCHGVLDGVCDAVCRFIYVPQVMRFIDDNQIPFDLHDIGIFRSSEVIRANDNLIMTERVQIAFLDLLVEGFRLQDAGGKKELVQEFLIPLFTEAGWHYDEELSFPFSPLLRKQNAGFNRFAKTNLICKDRSFREW
jgi:hypothetical protein